LTVIILEIFLTGCSGFWQTVKDNYEHQYNDNREDDASGEWFADRLPMNDTAQYVIILTCKLRNRTITKQVTLHDTASAVFNIKAEDAIQPIPITVICQWRHAKIYHKMFIKISNWAYTINFGTNENGETRIEDKIRIPKTNSYKIEIGVAGF